MYHIFVLSLTICLASSSRPLHKFQKHPDSEYIPNEILIRRRCGPHATICNSMDNYPIGWVHRHQKERPNDIEALLRKSDHVNVSIGPRISVREGEKDTEMCQTRKEVISPQLGLTKDDVWKWIFNTGEFGVEAVYCENPGGECELKIPGYTMTCEQKYVYKTLTAIGNTGSTENDQFKVPSGCICKYKRT